MSNQEKAQQIDKAIKELAGAASAYRHGRRSTAAKKLGVALDLLALVEYYTGG